MQLRGKEGAGEGRRLPPTEESQLVEERDTRRGRPQLVAAAKDEIRASQCHLSQAPQIRRGKMRDACIRAESSQMARG